jgi:hypothetical protein
MTPTFLMTGVESGRSLSTVDRNDVVLLEKPMVAGELVAEVRKALDAGRTEQRSVGSAPNLKG